jgi:3-deoxy-D-manno-octulosonic-acid transferase
MINFLLQLGYNVTFFAAFLLLWPYFTWRLRRRGPLQVEFWQRLGFYPPRVKERLKDGCDLWIHAVSVGENMIAAVLIRHLREEMPGCRIVLSTTTPTGYKVAKKLEDEQVTVIYNPTDFLWSVRQAFELIRPKRLILVEAEIWPNYMWCARRRGVPVYLVNARLSMRSESRFRRFRWFCEPVFRLLSLVLTQDDTDVERLTQVGVPSEIIFPVGSMKYDVAEEAAVNGGAIEAWWSKLGWAKDQPVLLAGSTHAGEERIVATHFREMLREFPDLKLVVAPRHAERGQDIADLCEEMGLKTSLRSMLAQGAELRNGSAPEVLVLDTTGELNAVYGKATVVFVGKSLRSKGGQNFIEAVRQGAAVVVGPNMQNFQQLTEEFVRRGGLLQVQNEFELGQRLRELLRSSERRAELGQNGRETYESNLGAGRKTASILAQSLKAAGCQWP